MSAPQAVNNTSAPQQQRSSTAAVVGRDAVARSAGKSSSTSPARKIEPLVARPRHTGRQARATPPPWHNGARGAGEPQANPDDATGQGSSRRLLPCRRLARRARVTFQGDGHGAV